MAQRVIGALLGAGLSLWAGAAAAQQAGEGEAQCVSADTAWSVCVWESPKECWAVSKPRETVNTRDGRTVSVRRGDILLFVTYRAGGASGEVSFTGGYPFAPGSTVGVEIDGQSFEFIADGEWAWPRDAANDATILEAMRGGATAILTGRSGRGTQTQDTFSLQGFTAALSEAQTRCQ
jgi:acid phosphatase class B